MQQTTAGRSVGLFTLLALGVPLPALGLDGAWTIYPDPETDAQCGLVNAWNAELVVLFDSGHMVVVTGTDTIIEDLFVSAESEVFYFDQPVGFLEFAEDGDNLPTLFWTTLSGTVVQINTFTGEPSDSGRFPDEVFDTGCDACDFVDQSEFCDDGGSGGSDNGNDNGSGGTIGDILIPLLCGAGSTSGVALSVMLLPLVGMCARRSTVRKHSR